MSDCAFLRDVQKAREASCRWSGSGDRDRLDEAADASIGSLAKCDKHGLATSMGWRRGLAALEVMRLTDLFERVAFAALEVMRLTDLTERVACATGMSRVQR